MKKPIKYTKEQLQEIELHKMNLQPETLMAEYRRVVEKRVASEAQAKHVRFNKDESVAIKLTPYVKQRAERIVRHSGFSAVKDSAMAVTVAMALDIGFNMIEHRAPGYGL